jgi:hypothetical protein
MNWVLVKLMYQLIEREIVLGCDVVETNHMLHDRLAGFGFGFFLSVIRLV